MWYSSEVRWQLPWSASEEVVALSGLSLTPPRVLGVVELLLGTLDVWLAVWEAAVAVGMLVAAGRVGSTNGLSVYELLPKLVVEASLAGLQTVSLESGTLHGNAECSLFCRGPKMAASVHASSVRRTKMQMSIPLGLQLKSILRRDSSSDTWIPQDVKACRR